MQLEAEAQQRQLSAGADGGAPVEYDPLQQRAPRRPSASRLVASPRGARPQAPRRPSTGGGQPAAERLVRDEIGSMLRAGSVSDRVRCIFDYERRVN